MFPIPVALMGGGSGSGTPVLTVVGGKTSGGGTTTITLTSVTIAAGSLIIVAVTSASNVTLSSVGDGTNTYTVDDSGTGNPCTAIASCADCVGLVGATVTATFSGLASTQSIAVYAVANMALSSPLDKKATASGTSTSPTATTAATTVNNTVVIGAVANTSPATRTEASGFTSDSGSTSGFQGNVAHKTVNPTTTGAQTYAPSFDASVSWRCLVAAYKGLS